MEREELINEFLLEFKPKKDQSWKSCYFFSHHLNKKHKIAVELLEGISKINKVDYWVVRFDNEDLDIHGLAMGNPPDFIENPEVIWSLKEFEKDNF